LSSDIDPLFEPPVESSEIDPVVGPLAASSSVHVDAVDDWPTRGDVLADVDVVESSGSLPVVGSSSWVGDVARLGVWVLAPSIDDEVGDDVVDEVDDVVSSPDRDITSWAVAGAVVNEMPPTEAIATAPVPKTRATPENMATMRFGLT
jgi:hypothetical protein